MTNNKNTVNLRGQKLIRSFHCICFALVTCLSALVDGNGHVLSLGYLASISLTVLIFASAICVSIKLAVKSRGLWRAVGLLSLLFYAALLLPLAMP